MTVRGKSWRRRDLPRHVLSCRGAQAARRESRQIDWEKAEESISARLAANSVDG
jgi:hypothetical protein